MTIRGVLALCGVVSLAACGMSPERERSRGQIVSQSEKGQYLDALAFRAAERCARLGIGLQDPRFMRCGDVAMVAIEREDILRVGRYR